MHLPVEPDIAAVAVGEERRRELRMIERARHDDALRLGAAGDADAAERLGPGAARGLDRASKSQAGTSCARASRAPVTSTADRDRTSVVEGNCVSVSVDLGGRGIIQKKKDNMITTTATKE